MGNTKVDLKQLEEFRDRVQKVADEEQQRAFMEACAKELAARLLAKVIKRTPVGDYSDSYDVEDDGQQKFLVMSEKQGGILRRGWTTHKAGSGAEGMETNNVMDFVDSLKINHFGDTYVIEVRNDVKYASYVEFGHRQTPGRYVPAIGKCLKKGWVPGQLMLTYSTNEIRKAAPGILEKKSIQKHRCRTWKSLHFLCAASIRMCREGLPAAEKPHCFLSCSIFRKVTSQRKRSIPFTNG